MLSARRCPPRVQAQAAFGGRPGSAPAFCVNSTASSLNAMVFSAGGRNDEWQRGVMFACGGRRCNLFRRP